jgi:hypothetical protein
MPAPSSGIGIAGSSEGDAMPDESEARKAVLEQIRKQSPGGQISAKEIYQPDPPAKSMQGPMEVTRATFANCKIKGGRRA